MIEPIIFRNDRRGILRLINTADIHFGVMDPEYQYNILRKQFIEPLYSIDFEVLNIIGDLFDKKFMSNSDAVMYAIRFISDCVDLCRYKNASIILIEGTKSHDAGQLKLFYKYLTDSTIEFYIVESIQFIYTKGARILCIPELYNLNEDYYNKYFVYSGMYDICLLHGVYKGCMYGANNMDLNNRYPIFDMSNFESCTGAIYAGHIHKAGCYDGYFHYCGNPYRWQFGEEEEKGFIIALHDLDTHRHSVQFIPIECLRFDTIELDYFLLKNPKESISYIENLKNSGIDFIRIKIPNYTDSNIIANINILKKYYQSNKFITILSEKTKDMISKDIETFKEENNEYSFILDKNLSPYEIMAKYINLKKGFIFTTPEEIIQILTEEI